MNNKERFIEIYHQNIHRPGADKLLDYLYPIILISLKLLQAQDSMEVMREAC